MNRKTVTITLNILSYVVMLVINFLAMTNLLGTYSTKQISEMYPNVLTPISITFSIMWTIIYLLQLIFIIFMIIKNNDLIVKKTSTYILFINILNSMWVLAFALGWMLPSVAIIVGMLICLYIVNDYANDQELLLPKVFFGFYFGWISVAAIVNIFTYVSYIDKTLFENSIVLTLAGIAIMLLAIVSVLNRKNITYDIVIALSFIGILLKHIIEYKLKYEMLAIVAILALVLVIIGILSETTMRSKKIENAKSF